MYTLNEDMLFKRTQEIA